MSVTVKLLGGLGNQMFQLAFGRALESRGYEVGYNADALVEGTHREYSLGRFADLSFGSLEGPTISEKDATFDIESLSPPNPSTMLGYWQSEKYFQNIKEDIRRLFSSEPPRPLQPNTIAVHVRRQDYVNLQHFHGLVPLDYYLRGVQRIREKTQRDCTALVVSDDIDWCRENFPSDFIFWSGDKYEDLRMMRSCDHAVIANSTFSWWGAWLQENPNKIVIAPEKWFADPSVNTKDLVPEGWVRL